MFQGLIAKLQAYMYIAIAFVVVAGICGLYFWYSQHRIEALTAELASARIQIATLTKTNAALKADAEFVRRETDRMNTELAEIRRKAAEDEKNILSFDPNAFGNDPAKIETEINTATQNRFRRIEALTRHGKK